MKELLLIFFIFDENNNELNTAVLLIIIGWAFGVLSSLIIPLIIEKIKKCNSKKEIKRGINTELKELQLRLTGICWETTTRYYNITKEWAKWIKPYYNSYEKSDEYYYPLTEPKRMDTSKFNDDMFYEFAINEQKVRKSNTSLFRYAKITLLYLESKYNVITSFEENFQKEIIKLRKETISINEEFEEINTIQMKMYEDIPEHNRKVAYENLNVINKRISVISKRIIILIENILQI